jgi:hypothetical protein
MARVHARYAGAGEPRQWVGVRMIDPTHVAARDPRQSCGNPGSLRSLDALHEDVDTVGWLGRNDRLTVGGSRERSIHRDQGASRPVVLKPSRRRSRRPLLSASCVGMVTRAWLRLTEDHPREHRYVSSLDLPDATDRARSLPIFAAWPRLTDSADDSLAGDQRNVRCRQGSAGKKVGHGTDLFPQVPAVDEGHGGPRERPSRPQAN